MPTTRHLLLLLLLAALVPRVSASQLVNVSARGLASPGADAMFGGFVISAGAPKKVLLRAAGPALAQFGVPGALAAPQLALFRDDGTPLAANSGWDAGPSAAQLAAAASAAGAFPFAPGTKDAALLVTLAPGAYTAQISPAANAAPGVTLLEIYDADPATTSRLANLSVRARVGTGADILIAGFSMSGPEASRLLIRGSGPALAAFGVPGTLADPDLAIVQSGVVIARNDNWPAHPLAAVAAAAATASGAFSFPPASRDAALLLDYANGGYSAQVSGRNNGTGVALLEIYDATTVSPPPAPTTDFTPYNVAGFAAAATGGGPLAETDANYRKVSTAIEFVAALALRTVKVIEITNDLDLGWNEIPAAARTGAFRADAVPLLHPTLKASGVTIIDIQDKTGVTIFSPVGATIRHAHFNLKRMTNVVIRNLRFDELWEWDESSKGSYDKQDWDFMTIDSASKTVWVDHCDFAKVYDGVLDVKGGSSDVTISWCRFDPGEAGPGTFIRAQLDELELNRAANPMFDFLRTNGFSLDDIAAVARPQKKGHLVGATELDPLNANLTVTLHHNFYRDMQDRMPRLRAGNAHAYNLHVDNSSALAARSIREARVATMSAAAATRLGSTYSFNVTLNGSISTESGALLLEKSSFLGVASPVRNNQVSATQPIYTGKIRALDVIYSYNGSTFRGGSDTADSPLAPVPAPVVPFAWNTATGTLPYSYTPDDPATLATRLPATNGAGAGRLVWAKANWLRTSY